VLDDLETKKNKIPGFVKVGNISTEEMEDDATKKALDDIREWVIFELRKVRAEQKDGFETLGRQTVTQVNEMHSFVKS
jgi:hypothetical protein